MSFNSPLSYLFENPINFLIFIIVVLISLTVHEFAHAYSAYKLGDNTAKFLNRLNLDPRNHIDLFGAFMFLIVGIGWGKPVPVNPNNFSDPKRDNAIVSFAGPMTNFILAFLGFWIYNLSFVDNVYLIFFLENLIMLNIILGVFNLIPVPPLDGGHILVGVLPNSIAFSVERFLMQNGPVILYSIIGLDIFFHTGILSSVINFFTNKILFLFSLILI